MRKTQRQKADHPEREQTLFTQTSGIRSRVLPSLWIVYADMHKQAACEKAVTVEGFTEAHGATRLEKFGWVVQPIGSVVPPEPLRAVGE